MNLSLLKIGAIAVKNGKQMLHELESRKKKLVEELKKLNTHPSAEKTSDEEFQEKKRRIERELVEIMDRITQLNYIMKK